MRPDTDTPFRRVLYLLSVLSLLVAATAPPAAADERRWEEIAIGWVEAHNSGSVETMAAFRAAHRKTANADGWQESFADLGERLGRLEVGGVMIDRPEEVTLMLQSEGSGRIRAIFRFSSDDPEQIESIRLDLSGGRPNPLPELELSGADWTARAAEIDAYLERLAGEGLYSGTVLVAQGGEVRFRGAYGLASREFEAPNTVDTRFDIGSITKDFTRVAIAQLIAAGKIGVDDPLGKYLPDYPNAEAREKVTIRHLFHHRAGVGDYFTPEWLETPMGALQDHDDYIRIWGPKPLEFEPGSKSSYSNFGFTLLGKIVEVVSGKPYFDYVAEQVFEPAGMTRSGFFATDEVVPDVAVGYTRMQRGGERGDTLRKNIYLEPVVGGPWGKTYCTVDDLWRFWKALSEHRLTPPAYTPWVLLEGPPPAPGETGPADAPPPTSVGLGGGGPGLAAELEVSGDLVIIALANLDPPVTRHLAERLSEALR